MFPDRSNLFQSFLLLGTVFRVKLKLFTSPEYVSLSCRKLCMYVIHTY